MTYGMSKSGFCNNIVLECMRGRRKLEVISAEGIVQSSLHHIAPKLINVGG